MNGSHEGLIVLQGTSTCEKYDEDDNSSGDEWVDISHSSEDDADKNVDTQKDASDRREVDQKHRAMNQNENGDGDEVSPFMSLECSSYLNTCFTTTYGVAPKSNCTLNLAHKLEVVVQCVAGQHNTPAVCHVASI